MAIHIDDPEYQLANAWRSSVLDVVSSPAPHTAGRWPPPDITTVLQRPLQIGYVSPDLREHAIGYLTAELFELHNRTKIEVFAYFSGPGTPDAIQARIRQNVDHWRAIADWSDKQTALQIVQDKIDILVDLGGHTCGAPASAFRLRPAPVIVNWLGYPGSMGTPHHQYIVADPIIIPPLHEKSYSERVVRLPCYQPTDRKQLVTAPPSRRAVGLAEDAVVYCCFNGTQKIRPAMFRTWMAILARAPNVILWLLSCDPATDDRLRQQAAKHGVAPERLVFAKRKPNAEHLARYPLADLFLDTSPYGAHTTASDALWMGVPVLTLIGRSFAARVCASLVTAAGLPELVCTSPESYEGQAVELAKDPTALFAFRERLRAGRDSCVLFDMPRLVTHLESLYEQMWQDYLHDEVPEPDLAGLAEYAEVADGFDQETTEALAFEVKSEQPNPAASHETQLPAQPDRRRQVELPCGFCEPTAIAAPDINAHQPQGPNVMTISVISKGRGADLALKVEEALNATIATSDSDFTSGFYSIEGMSGRKYRYFINTLVHAVDQPRYLEIGSWAGSTLCAAIHGNDVDAIAIDNWSEFGGPKQVFADNVALYKTPQAKVQFIEADFRHVDYRRIASRNIYLYDGPHDEQDQHDGLRMALECLDRQFVFIVDDWNWNRVRSGNIFSNQGVRA